MDDQAQRFQTLLNALKTNQSRFSEDIGVQYAQTNAVYNARGEFSRGYLQKLTAKYPQVNLHWLLTGVGEMLLPEQQITEEKSQQQPKKSNEKYNKNVPDSTVFDDIEMRKTLAKNLKTLARRWRMKKNELFGILVPGVKKPTVTNYFAGNSQPPLSALIKLEDLTGIGLSAWVTNELHEDELPFEPLVRVSESKEVKLENVRESLRALLAKMGG